MSRVESGATCGVWRIEGLAKITINTALKIICPLGAKPRHFQIYELSHPLLSVRVELPGIELVYLVIT